MEQFAPLQELQDEIYGAINNALRPTSNWFEIVKAMTGGGKSFAYRKIMSENPSKRFLIAASANILKDEIFDKALEEGLDVIKTPSLEAEEVKTTIPARIRKRIQKLYKTGRHCLVHPFITDTLKKENIPSLRKYLEEREKLKSFDDSVITTHRYLMSMTEKRQREFDAVIIDEDVILKSIISNQGEITITDLDRLMMESSNVRLIKKAANLLKLYETQTCIETDSFEYDNDDMEKDGISMPFDIPSFCSTKRFYVRRASKERNLKEDTIAFIKSAVFHKSVKYIVVSATAEEWLYSKIFGDDNVNFYECKQARYKGDLLLYPGKSMSRTSIDNNPGIIKRLMKRFGIDNVITFMKYNIGLLHFGNTEGSNALEAKDILIIGTPYHAEFLYKLVAFTFGFDFDEEAVMKLQLVTCVM